MKSASYFVLNFGLQRCLEAVRMELTELFDGVANPLRLGFVFPFLQDLHTQKYIPRTETA